MNGFVIATGAYFKELTDKALVVSEKIGRVHVEMNGTACKVPLATEYINKIIETSVIGKKRKSSRCKTFNGYFVLLPEIQADKNR